MELRWRHDPLEVGIEGDHSERVFGLQQLRGLDGGLARHSDLRCAGRGRATRDDIHAARSIDDQEQRQAALLWLNGWLGGNRQHIVEHGALVATRREGSWSADY